MPSGRSDTNQRVKIKLGLELAFIHVRRGFEIVKNQGLCFVSPRTFTEKSYSYSLRGKALAIPSQPEYIAK